MRLVNFEKERGKDMKKWSEKTTLEKVADIIAAIALCVWLITEFLADKGMASESGLGTYISLSVICVCEAISFWNVKRVLSYVAIAGMVLMLTAAILLAMPVTQ